MRKSEITSKMLTAVLAASMAVNPAMVFAATTNDALDGTKDAATNPTSSNNDQKDYDTIDKDAKGSLTIHKYDLTSAQKDGLNFVWSETDHDSDGTASKLTKDGKDIDITSNGKQNTAAEDAMKDYAIKGVEFTYLRVGSVKTLSDINEDNINGDIELIYGVDADLMTILGLKKYDAATKGTGYVAVTQVDGVNYFTPEQIRNALKDVLAKGTYEGSYATGEEEGKGTSNGSGNRLDNKTGVTAVDALENYITTDGDAHKKGVAMPETDASGVTKAENLDLGMYLVVETKVPENVTETVSPFFVQIPMTTIEGTNWFYNVHAYPKNNTGHPDLTKQVRHAYGTPGLNHDSDGNATYTTGDKVTKADSLTAGKAGIVTNNDSKAADDSTWLTEGKKALDYEWHDTITASEGEVLDYKLVSRLPNITSKKTALKRFEYIDTLSKGLKYNNDVKIAIYNNKDYADVNDTTHAIDVWTQDKGSNYKFTIAEAQGKTDGSNALDIKVTDAGLDEIANKYYDGQHWLVVYYTATLQSNANTVLGDKGNPNDVTLIWARTAEGYYNTLEDESIVYSYGLDLQKLFSDKNTKAADFKAVKFVLYNETEDYYVVAEPEGKTDGLYYVTGKTISKDNATVFSPSEKGFMVINGIEGDDYELTEIETAKGYTLGQNQVRFTINQASREITASSVHYMTVAKDHSDEHSKDDKTLTLSDGTTLKSKDEGTTDKEGMVIGDLVPTTATIDGAKADMCKYGSQSIGAELINAIKGGTAAADSENADIKMSITNHKGFSLPKTGGNGTYVATIVGIIGFAIGCYFISENRKKKAKAQ